MARLLSAWAFGTRYASSPSVSSIDHRDWESRGETGASFLRTARPRSPGLPKRPDQWRGSNGSGLGLGTNDGTLSRFTRIAPATGHKRAAGNCGTSPNFSVASLSSPLRYDASDPQSESGHSGARSRSGAKSRTTSLVALAGCGHCSFGDRCGARTPGRSKQYECFRNPTPALDSSYRPAIVDAGIGSASTRFSRTCGQPELDSHTQVLLSLSARIPFSRACGAERDRGNRPATPSGSRRKPA